MSEDPHATARESDAGKEEERSSTAAASPQHGRAPENEDLEPKGVAVSDPDDDTLEHPWIVTPADEPGGPPSAAAPYAPAGPAASRHDIIPPPPDRPESREPRTACAPAVPAPPAMYPSPRERERGGSRARHRAGGAPVGRLMAAAEPLIERKGKALPGRWAILIAVLALGLCLIALRHHLPFPLPGALSARRRTHEPVRPVEVILCCLWAVVSLCAFGGLTRGEAGRATVLSRRRRYLGTVRQTGLLWVSPFASRRTVDVRIRRWRSDAMDVTDADGTPLRIVLQVVWQVRDTARAVLGVADHEAYLRDHVQACLTELISRLPSDTFSVSGKLCDLETFTEELTRLLAGGCRPVGLKIYLAQPVNAEYAPGIVETMRHRHLAALEAQHHDEAMTSMVAAIDETLRGMTTRGFVDMDRHERNALVRELTIVFSRTPETP